MGYNYLCKLKFGEYNDDPAVIDIDNIELDYERLITINHSYFIGAIQINHPKGFYSSSDLTGIKGKSGDYVLIGSDRKRYICSKEEFERYYER